MHVSLHNKFRDAQSLPASTVVVYDQLGNPVVVAIETGPGVILAATAEHPEFNSLLQGLGLRDRVVVKDALILPPPLRGH